jgi:hypothetical protein
LEEKEPRIFNFKVSIEEAEAIDADAKKLGMSRSDYIRTRVLSPIINAPFANLEALLRFTIWTQNRLHIAMFSIPQAMRLKAEKLRKEAGTSTNKSFQEAVMLEDEDLKSIYDDALARSLDFMVMLDRRILNLEGAIAEASQNTSGDNNG